MNSYVSTRCPVVICPYLCTSEVREHDPKRPDLFVVAAGELANRALGLTAPEINRVSALYRQLNLPDVPLFEALGERLVLLSGASAGGPALLGPPGPILYYNSCDIIGLLFSNVM